MLLKELVLNIHKLKARAADSLFLRLPVLVNETKLSLDMVKKCLDQAMLLQIQFNSNNLIWKVGSE